MPRPKTDLVIGLRISRELLTDLDAEAERRGMTRSDWIKETIENRMKFMWGLRADWFDLRTLDPVAPRLHCSTDSQRVEQGSTDRRSHA